MPEFNTKTTHIFPMDEGWIVVKDHLFLDERDYKKSVPSVATVYRTQKKAVEAARKIVEQEPAGQVVVHSRTGLIRRPYAHGLPTAQKSPVKSDLGTKAIERAVSSALRERLLGS